MEVLPVRTPILNPPQHDLAPVLAAALPPLGERDVLCVSSKVVAIDEGRCVPIAAAEKSALISQEADIEIAVAYKRWPLTVKHHAFLGSAGIDESNGDGYYVLQPSDPFASAARLHAWVTAHAGLAELGLVITDSHSQPFRLGATGVAAAWWGIAPLVSHIGETDLFGRELRCERSNIVDGLAATATLVMGETDAAVPVAIIRGAPDIQFTGGDTREHLFVSPEHDHFRVLYERFV